MAEMKVAVVATMRSGYFQEGGVRLREKSRMTPSFGDRTVGH